MPKCSKWKGKEIMDALKFDLSPMMHQLYKPLIVAFILLVLILFAFVIIVIKLPNNLIGRIIEAVVRGFFMVLVIVVMGGWVYYFFLL